MDLASLFPTPSQSAPRARPAMLAQHLELLARRDAYAVTHDLQLGDLVRFKPGLSSLRHSETQDHALMLWRFLDPSDPVDTAIRLKTVAAGGELRPNAIVVILSSDGACLSEIIVDRATLEPLSDADLVRIHRAVGLPGTEVMPLPPVAEPVQ